MGLLPRHIRQVFSGRRRSPDRYEHVARTLSWSVHEALIELGVAEDTVEASDEATNEATQRGLAVAICPPDAMRSSPENVVHVAS